MSIIIEDKSLFSVALSKASISFMLKEGVNKSSPFLSILLLGEVTNNLGEFPTVNSGVGKIILKI